MSADSNPGEDIFDMKAWRAKTREPEEVGDKPVATPKARRKAREQKVKDSVSSSDGRSLRATGRTEHLVLKAHPRIVKVLDEYVGKGKKSKWVEEAILAKLEAEGYDLDAVE